jgi:Protein of unknown function (DUF4019)
LNAPRRGAKPLWLALALLAPIALIVASLAIAGDEATSIAQAEDASKSWLLLVDSGDYRESWIKAASFFKDRVSMDEWEQQAGGVRDPLGAVVSRKLNAARYATSLPGAPDGKYVVLQYKTSFAHKKSAIETVTPMLDKDGVWRVSGYYIK